ncbi:MAG: DUF4390 domain-containing protein [Zoogloeaceae bacterium]|nr:DUF4390 domain-containing protein [Zoogloeaceae bacterium]
MMLAVSAGALAAEIEIRNAQLSPEDGGQALSADFSIDFNPRLEEAVSKGLVLHFVAEFELNRPRWYWFDEKVVRTQQTWRLNYHALTQKYRLSNGALHLTLSSLSEAVHILSRLRNWLVIERDRATPGDSFEAALRMRLDTSQLPKPFQVEALSNRDWVLSSDWKRWHYTVPSPAPALPPVPAGGESK